MKNFFVFTNLAISMDGKISTANRDHIPSTPYDGYRMDLHRARAAAVLTGAVTLRGFKQPITIKRSALKWWRKLRGLPPNPINVVLATKLDFDISWPFFTSEDTKRILIVPDTTPREQAEPFLQRASVFFYDSKQSVAPQIVDYLKSQGIRNLLLEGGGGVMFPWVEADCIDEWNITVSPKIIGGAEAPTMVEGKGFMKDAIKYYRLKKHWAHQNEVFLVYTRY